MCIFNKFLWLKTSVCKYFLVMFFSEVILLISSWWSSSQSHDQNTFSVIKYSFLQQHQYHQAHQRLKKGVVFDTWTSLTPQSIIDINRQSKNYVLAYNLPNSDLPIANTQIPVRIIDIISWSTFQQLWYWTHPSLRILTIFL